MMSLIYPCIKTVVFKLLLSVLVATQELFDNEFLPPPRDYSLYKCGVITDTPTKLICGVQTKENEEHSY